MQSTNIKNLSREEKLKMMEEIWEDLSREQIASPDWHQEALQETARRMNTGQEKVMDWSVAKNELRKRFE